MQVRAFNEKFRMLRKLCALLPSPLHSNILLSSKCDSVRREQMRMGRSNLKGDQTLPPLNARDALEIETQNRDAVLIVLALAPK